MCLPNCLKLISGIIYFLISWQEKVIFFNFYKFSSNFEQRFDHQNTINDSKLSASFKNRLVQGLGVNVSF